MRTLVLIAALSLLGLFAPQRADAQDSDFHTYTCHECRDVYDHPEDFRNFAFNEVFGPNPTISLDGADFFFVRNSAGQRVGVDINLDISFLTIDFAVPIRVPWPTGYTVQIILNLPNGDQEPYTIEPRAYSDTGLPVGDQGGIDTGAAPPSEGAGGSNGEIPNGGPLEGVGGGSNPYSGGGGGGMADPKECWLFITRLNGVIVKAEVICY